MLPGSAPSPASVSDASGAASAASGARRSRLFWAGFGAIFLLGASLRFVRLGEQSFWCDETATALRVVGSFHHLLISLRGQGFPPGWYALLWSWLQFLQNTLHVPAGWAQTPWLMRSPGAALGTLNVAAAYFLARQFTDRRVALLVMLLSAVNPFFVYYSRDLKMYSAFYLLATLNTAIFVKWLGSRHWPWAPLYALTALGMIAVDFLGWIVLGIHLVWLLASATVAAVVRTVAILRRWQGKVRDPEARANPTAPALRGASLSPRPAYGVRRWRWWGLVLWPLLWLLAIAPAGAFTAWWGGYHTNWFRAVVWRHADGGLGWIDRFNIMSWHTVLGGPTIDLLGYLWPVYPPTVRMIHWLNLGPDYMRHLATRSWPWLATAERWLALLTFAVLLAGLLPWRRWAQHRPRKCPDAATGQPPNGCEGVQHCGVAPNGRGDDNLGGGKLETRNPKPETRNHLEESLRRRLKTIPVVSPPAGRWWHVGLWLALTLLLFALGSLPAGNPWSIYPHRVVWLSRYMGFMAVGWVLWLGAALSRLPTRMLRWSAGAILISAMTAASLTNAAVCLIQPWDFINRPIAHFYSPQHREEMLIGYSTSFNIFLDPAVSWLQQQHLTLAPTGRIWRGWGRWAKPWAEVPPYRLLGDGPAGWRNIIQLARHKARLKTLVLADRMGDEPSGVLGTAAINRQLGPGWRLVFQTHFRWYFHWRYYFFSPWRVRVWRRISSRVH